MKIVEPKCPNCSKTKFAYKHIPRIDLVKSVSKTLSDAEERFKSFRTGDDKTERQVSNLRKRLDTLFHNPQRKEAEAMMVFCINCGEIIGIGGGFFNI